MIVGINIASIFMQSVIASKELLCVLKIFNGVSYASGLEIQLRYLACYKAVGCDAGEDSGCNADVQLKPIV